MGRPGELASNRRAEQEWQGVLTDADRRSLTPIFHSNMTPYGEIQLRTDRRLELTSLPGEAGLDQQPNGQRL
ncbi:hypothetical protein Misp01_20910 [Microtetraspora sp. NBRC 13810]|nr:hypothetical protein Misp01_20910 [Microtetraspora sp. NBRC 13810]